MGKDPPSLKRIPEVSPASEGNSASFFGKLGTFLGDHLLFLEEGPEPLAESLSVLQFPIWNTGIIMVLSSRVIIRMEKNNICKP